MATITDSPQDDHGADAPSLSLRERGRLLVRALGEVSKDLQPLQAKLDAGQQLTKRQVKRYGQLTVRYRELEQQMRELMRPRQRIADAALRGLDHIHLPGGGTVDVDY